jgi:hypothetical protein
MENHLNQQIDCRAYLELIPVQHRTIHQFFFSGNMSIFISR